MFFIYLKFENKGVYKLHNRICFDGYVGFGKWSTWRRTTCHVIIQVHAT